MDLKQIRKEKNLTQQQSADILGISRRSYQMIEKDGPEDQDQKYDYYCTILSKNGQNIETAEQKEVSIGKERFRTNVVYGQALKRYNAQVSSFNKRKCYSELLKYVNGDYLGKVCILYGLRRTGKTTLLLQLIEDLDINKTVYIKILEKNTMGDLLDDINKLTEMGIQYFLIDEVTLLEDFINSASALSDIYCQAGQKIILSGTDSLGFSFAKRDELYDRTMTIHTSYIPYNEFCVLMHNSDIDEYIEYGGTLQKENMSFDDPDSKDERVAFREEEATRKYIDTAISKNIQRSLENDRFGSRFYCLRELYDKNELTNVINRLIENMNHKFLLSVITERFKSHDLGSARQILYHRQDKELQVALNGIDEKSVISKLKEIIEIKEQEEAKIQVSQEVIDQIKQYLYELDLLKDIEIRYDDGSSETMPVFTQPGMRYSIAKALCYSVMKDSYIQTLSERAKKAIIETILNDVKGRMLEDIVLLYTTRRNPKEELVFKYIRKNNVGEIDMVIYNKEKDTFDMYEIKHTKEMHPEEQSKNLNNDEIKAELSQKYGKLVNKYILYRGDATGGVGSVYYKNVNEFLCGY